jgi:hypothetical protein
MHTCTPAASFSLNGSFTNSAQLRGRASGQSLNNAFNDSLPRRRAQRLPQRQSSQTPSQYPQGMSLPSFEYDLLKRFVICFFAKQRQPGHRPIQDVVN